MECSRDSCHHMRYIDCSSAMILGTFRLLSAPDPPWTGRLDQRKFSSSRLQRVSRRCIYIYRYRYMHYTSYISQIFLLIQSRPTLCVVYLCPRDLLKRRHGFSPSSRFVSFLKETKKENVRAQRCKFTRHFGDSFSLTRELALVSGGDLLITYFQVTLENHGIQTS